MILTFPPKGESTKVRTPVETLERVLTAINENETEPEGLIVVWNVKSDNEEVYKMRFIVGGHISQAAAVGLLEMAKSGILK